MPIDDNHPFLEARHVDDLTAAVNSLTVTMRIQQTKDNPVVLAIAALRADIAENTKAMNRLIHFLVGKTLNGDVLHDGSNEGDRDDR